MRAQVITAASPFIHFHLNIKRRREDKITNCAETSGSDEDLWRPLVAPFLKSEIHNKLCVHVVFVVKEECVSEEEAEEEEETVKDVLVEEILQQGDTAIIYPEAPEDEQSPAETGGADENGRWGVCERTVELGEPRRSSPSTFSPPQEPPTPSPSCTPAPTAPGATSATPR